MSTSGGIIWSVVAAATVATELAAEKLGNLNAQGTRELAQSNKGPYRPAQWSQAPQTSITLTSTSSVTTAQVDNLQGTATSNASAATSSASSSTDVYVFDAILRAEHSQTLRKTEHPVQSGASISDHAFILPARITLEIGMSDAMDAYTPGVWTSSPSKSVSAYQILVALQQGRQPLTVNTRLATYSNMLIESIQVQDTVETRNALRATVTFGQIFTGVVTLTKIQSDRPQTTDSTSIGTKAALPISDNDLKRFTTLLPTPVPGAGEISSFGSTGP